VGTFAEGHVGISITNTALVNDYDHNGTNGRAHSLPFGVDKWVKTMVNTTSTAVEMKYSARIHA